MIQGSLSDDKLTLERKLIDVYLRRAFYDPTQIMGLDGKVRSTEEELLRTGPYVCIDGIDIKVDKFGKEHITYRFMMSPSVNTGEDQE